MHLVLFNLSRKQLALETFKKAGPALGRNAASGGLLVFAPDHGPALQLRDRLALLDPHRIARLELVALVVRMVVLGAADRLLIDRMGETAIDAHNHRLGLLVADDHALQRTFRHSLVPYFFFARCSAAMVLMRAISRRASL